MNSILLAKKNTNPEQFLGNYLYYNIEIIYNQTLSCCLTSCVIRYSSIPDLHSISGLSGLSDILAEVIHDIQADDIGLTAEQKHTLESRW